MSVETIHGYTADQVRAAEAPGLERGEPLMQRAAAGLAAALRTVLPDDGGVVLILAGSGNNGADALYAGAELAGGRPAGPDPDHGDPTPGTGTPEGGAVSVAVVPTGDRLHPEALAAALEAGVRLFDASEAASLAASADVVVDGVLGTGTSSGSSALRGPARDIVAAVLAALMENEQAYVVAVDIPSGVDPDDGSVPDPLVLPADITVTFGARKAGLLIAPGLELAGQVRLVDIGLGAEYAAMPAAVSVDAA
jgi:NAD(P)H-hydrate epimerase